MSYQTFLLDLIKLVIGVCVGSLVGVKITKRGMKKEITSYLTNELPHLLASPKTELYIRKYAHVLFQEFISIIMEEEEDAEENRKVHETRGKRTSAGSQSRGLKRLPSRKA